MFTHGKGQKVTKLVASMFRNVSYNCVLSNQGTGFVAVNECYPACKHTAASWECVHIGVHEYGGEHRNRIATSIHPRRRREASLTNVASQTEKSYLCGRNKSATAERSILSKHAGKPCQDVRNAVFVCHASERTMNELRLGEQTGCWQYAWSKTRLRLARAVR